jgi:Zn finger protein HypA/HybF involved in hydrogenase expression
MTVPEAPAGDGVACHYCQNAMLRVDHGWHCPACHATAGQPEPAAR